MRFIVDAQLPPALARWLAEQGHEAEHVFDFGKDGTTDAEILLAVGAGEDGTGDPAAQIALVEPLSPSECFQQALKNPSCWV
jgi:hypothetical protein